MNDTLCIHADGYAFQVAFTDEGVILDVYVQDEGDSIAAGAWEYHELPVRRTTTEEGDLT